MSKSFIFAFLILMSTISFLIWSAYSRLPSYDQSEKEFSSITDNQTFDSGSMSP